MTKSKSPSLAIQGTRSANKSGTHLFLVFVGKPRQGHAVEPAAGFHPVPRGTRLLAFVSFLPSSFKHPAARLCSAAATRFIASKKDYISFRSFLSIPFPDFFYFFSGNLFVCRALRGFRLAERSIT